MWTFVVFLVRIHVIVFVKSKTVFYNLHFKCFPLYSLLLSVGNPTVNLFVLDIEGAEFEVAFSFDNYDYDYDDKNGMMVFLIRMKITKQIDI